MNTVLRLKEFYLLELFQVRMYKAQVDSLQNEYIRHVYENMVSVEQRHVDFFKQMIKKLRE